MSLPPIFAERERLHAARTDVTRRYHQRVNPSPVGVVEQAEELPVFRLGVDAIPTRCGHCPAGHLERQAPIGEHPFGDLTCLRCGRQAAWLKPAPRAMPATAPQRALAAPTARQQPKATQRPPEPLSEPDWRLLGCSSVCTRGRHCPKSHEAFGRRCAFEEIEAQKTPTGLMRTGALAVDFDVMRVTVNGCDAGLTVTELRILMHLAAHLGQTCLHADIVRSVWDDEQLAVWLAASNYHTRWHALRININRTRQKLGGAAALIETVAGSGYRLRAVAPT